VNYHHFPQESKDLETPKRATEMHQTPDKYLLNEYLDSTIIIQATTNHPSPGPLQDLPNWCMTTRFLLRLYQGNFQCPDFNVVVTSLRNSARLGMSKTKFGCQE
jgi:hypothetical protein